MILRPDRHSWLIPRGACGLGFIAHVRGDASHDIIEKGVEILANLTHRGSTGQDPRTGDGAGLLIQVPHRFFEAISSDLPFELPAAGAYAVGNLFLSQDEDVRSWQVATLERAIADEGLGLLGWREVPVEPDALGWLARERMPHIRQVFVDDPHRERRGLPLERALYVLRRVVENRARARGGEAWERFHVCSLSSRVMVYKGLLLPDQIEPFYPDLADRRMQSALALVHQRYSTNTFPTWDLAQPLRFLAHNGEINTMRGNAGWMRARQHTLRNDVLGAELDKVLPVLREDASDSFQLDNALELLALSGRSLAHAMCMLIPEAWEMREEMDPDRRAFYEVHANLMEPWDGPASIAFTDGIRIGAVLDRNGLRPSRIIETKDGHVVMASEAGVLDIPPDQVVRKGRLRPGRVFLVDMAQGRILSDEEIKAQMVGRRPYRRWLDRYRLRLEDLSSEAAPAPLDAEARARNQRAFAYTLEDERIVLAPMIGTGKEAIGSMGDDAALACLSDRPRLLFHYFKQQFAQVTNPPIDSIRERSVMSLRTTLGPKGNLLDEAPEDARCIELDHPILTDEQLASLRGTSLEGFRTRTLATTFESEGSDPLRSALADLCEDAARAVREGDTLLVLSDRSVGPDAIPIPSLLATAAVHTHLIEAGLRTRCSLIAETGEAREAGHFALLLGYGATAINPWLALDLLGDMVRTGRELPEGIGFDIGLENYLEATRKALLKIMAKMGISTVASYRGAQIFEAVGLSRELVDHHFPGTASRVGGVGLRVLAEEAKARHAKGWPRRGTLQPELDAGGLYQWRRRGERHVLDPETITRLRHAVHREDYGEFKRFTAAVDDRSRNLCTLRGLLDLQPMGPPIPPEEVEPVSEIVKRFCTGAMSYGSISAEAHETLAIAMNRLAGRSNSGEGGEDPARFAPDSSGDSRRSAIKQVASGRFGVTSWYLVNADELQIKMAQGAKPGEGGQLPGHKVSAEIARIRHSTEGVTLISPPPHHDIYSIEDLAQLIHDLKCANDRATVSVKLVSESGVGTIAAGVSKGRADHLLISGHDGGTGASPQTSIKSAGLPWEIGLAETQATLVANNLRGRIRVQVDGGLRTARDVLIGAMLGADEFGFSTAPLLALGCIMMRVCQKNTCPVGIATQDPELRDRFEGTPEQVVRYFTFLAQEMRERMASLGVRHLDDLVGRVDLLRPDRDVMAAHWKARHLDFSELLYRPDVAHPIRHVERQEHELDDVLDRTLIEGARDALDEGSRVVLHHRVRNVDRTVGTLLGAEVSRRWGGEGLPDDTIRIHLEGSTGQSLGAWLPRGITLEVEGDANDYVGKGLSGGRIVVRAPGVATFAPTENVLIGNVALYGATAGIALFHGRAGERFCVRNSGASAVVEGIGDHGCEYMTGGRVVILGPTGRNFAAGMSGGVAYVLDGDGRFDTRCNRTSVDLEGLDEEDEHVVLDLIRRHRRWTSSRAATEVLQRWSEVRRRFVKVMPVEFKRALGRAREREVSVA